MSKIIVIGDTVAPYHPLSTIFPIAKALSEESLTFTNDYGFFQKLGEYDLLICHVDAWFKQLAENEAGGLLDYLSNGGRMLSIHTGMSIQATPALASLHGAKFLDHPPYCELTINVKKEHHLADSVESFMISDEPYHFEVYEELDVFASYVYNDSAIPAAWEKAYGKGKLIYLMPGHDEMVFRNAEYLKLIKNCVGYLTLL